MKTITTVITRLVREEEGQDLIEYALLAALIALAAMVAMEAVGGGIEARFNQIVDTLTP